MSEVQKPSKEMLENLNLLMNLDLLKDESDWAMLSTFNLTTKPVPQPSPSPAAAKEQVHEQ